MGAGFDTGNLGVNALADSSLKLLRYQWPDAELILFPNGLRPERIRVSAGGRNVDVESIPLRYNAGLFVSWHYIWFWISFVVIRLFPFQFVRTFIFHLHPLARRLSEVDLFADITGGDSFSDIYGFKRYLQGFLEKWLVLLAGGKLILLPQTYGPFRGQVARRRPKASRSSSSWAQWGQ